MRWIIIATVGLGLVGGAGYFTRTAKAQDDCCTATCRGATPCNACKNCKYCAHCNDKRGTCGVCKK